jgi:hypothetical protein
LQSGARPYTALWEVYRYTDLRHSVEAYAAMAAG